MAKHNHARLTGRLKSYMIHENRLYAKLQIMREKTKKIDEPVVLVSERDLIEKIKSYGSPEQILNRTDLYITIRGMIETYNVDADLNCNHCGTPYTRNVTKTFVRARKLSLFESDTPVYDNAIHVLGSLVSSVTSNPVKTGTMRSTYKMGVNFHRDIAHYPWIVSFHDQAKSDAERMKDRSQCMVYGFFQTREISIGCTCPACFKQQKIDITTGEILAVSVVYLNNCKFESEEEEEKLGRHNHARLTGRLHSYISVEDRIFAKIEIQRENSKKIDYPILLIESAELIDKIQSAGSPEEVLSASNIFVSIRGQIETYDVALNLTCTNESCSEFFGKDVVKSMVRARRIDVFRTNTPVYDNTIHLLGTLSTPVAWKEVATKAFRSTYRIGTNYHKGKGHFPYVVSFHDQAFTDKERMRENSQCMVYGFFQTRNVNISCECPECTTEQKKTVTTAEILAVSVEYLNNCHFPEKSFRDDVDLMEKAFDLSGLESDAELEDTTLMDRIEGIIKIRS